MVKLKKGRVKIHICSTCKGNGFVKIIKTEDRESYVHQCWDCDSEGEFYETVSNDNIIDDFNGDNNHNNKLH
jgi:DnaJ-class molecular chaperone|tara:strand:+ start:98 stop:313 length:216 start_codon:yes stop_codon:yes gene_type:complete